MAASEPKSIDGVIDVTTSIGGIDSSALLVRSQLWEARGGRPKKGAMMTVRRLLVPVIAGCAVLGFATPAGATPPERFHSSDGGSEPGFIQCDGFEIDLQTTGTEDGTVFFNPAGEVVRFAVRTRATDILTNSVTGKTVVNSGVFQQVFTRIDGTDDFTHSLVGFRYKGTLPGEGLVLQDAGRIEYSPDEEEILFIAGHHFDIPGGDPEAVFCAALS